MEARINAWTNFDREKFGQLISKAKAVCSRFQIPVKVDLAKVTFESFIYPYAVYARKQFDLRFRDYQIYPT